MPVHRLKSPFLRGIADHESLQIMCAALFFVRCFAFWCKPSNYDNKSDREKITRLNIRSAVLVDRKRQRKQRVCDAPAIKMCTIVIENDRTLDINNNIASTNACGSHTHSLARTQSNVEARMWRIYDPTVFFIRACCSFFFRLLSLFLSYVHIFDDDYLL